MGATVGLERAAAARVLVDYGLEVYSAFSPVNGKMEDVRKKREVFLFWFKQVACKELKQTCVGVFLHA